MMTNIEINKILYGAREYERMHWCGVRIMKHPTDLWAYQHYLWSTKVNVLIECGAGYGGSAIYFRDCMRLMRGAAAKVISVSFPELPVLQNQSQLVSIVGRSTDPDIVRRVLAEIQSTDRVMVSLDSGHHAENVLAELRAYWEVVTPGCLLVVEDTNLNGNPVFARNRNSRRIQQEQGGPHEALQTFMQENAAFIVRPDPYIVTNNPGGWLRRKE